MSQVSELQNSLSQEVKNLDLNQENLMENKNIDKIISKCIFADENFDQTKIDDFDFLFETIFETKPNDFLIKNKDLLTVFNNLRSTSRDDIWNEIKDLDSLVNNSKVPDKLKLLDYKNLILYDKITFEILYSIAYIKLYFNLNQNPSKETLTAIIKKLFYKEERSEITVYPNNI